MKGLLIILLFISSTCYSQVYIRMINGVGDTIPIPDPIPGNNAPIITSVGVTPSVIRLPLDSATLIGHSTDYDGTVTLVHWAKVIGGSVTVVSPDDSTTKVRNLTAGTYRFSYQVTDDDGDIAVRYYEFTVLPEIIVTPPGTCWDFSLQTSSGSLTYTNQHDFVIENKKFEMVSGNCITLNNCYNVTIRNCYMGTSQGFGVEILGGHDNTITDNMFANNRIGVHVQNVTAGGIKIRYNQFYNVHTGGGFRGNFTQFNEVAGAGNEISGNRIQCDHDVSVAEDLMSNYKVNGTSGSPVLIRKNIILGGSDVAVTGGAIQTGDGGGSWIICDSNTIYNPINFAIAASGGSNIVIKDNIIRSRTDGMQGQYYSAIYWANYSGAAGCSNITVQNNTVYGNVGTDFNPNTAPGYQCSASTGGGYVNGNNRQSPNGITVPEFILDLCPADRARILSEAHVYN